MVPILLYSEPGIQGLFFRVGLASNTATQSVPFRVHVCVFIAVYKTYIRPYEYGYCNTNYDMRRDNRLAVRLETLDSAI